MGIKLEEELSIYRMKTIFGERMVCWELISVMVCRRIVVLSWLVFHGTVWYQPPTLTQQPTTTKQGYFSGKSQTTHYDWKTKE
mmetsp:Transcript_32101/g.73797  ORF Transcript_32101/g.73797 Transcript_32101/m.73797 type:complete len:83 (-) Transcript_32101:437-685(-)